MNRASDEPHIKFEKEELETTKNTLDLKLGEWKYNYNDKTIIEKNNIWTIKNFLSPQECSDLIRFSESLGFVGEDDSEYRSQKRTVWHDPAFSEQIWNRAMYCVPKDAAKLHTKSVAGKGYEPCGCYDQMRFYRYDPQEKFESHLDKPRVIKEKKSFLTCLIYLNDVTEGGSTAFYGEVNSEAPKFKIAPVSGTCLFFVHGGFINRHEGEPIPENSNQRKYVLRTDILYQPKKVT
jgi:hypothetical protein